jgi:hypothetical protein
MSVSLCFAAKARLYNLKTGEVLEMKFSRGIFGGGHGKISLKLTDGTMLQGEYSTVPEGSASWGAIFATANGPGGAAYGSGVGRSYSVKMGVPGLAIIAGNGHIIQCEFRSNAMSGHGSGGCKGNDGVIYKLMY